MNTYYVTYSQGHTSGKTGIKVQADSREEAMNKVSGRGSYIGNKWTYFTVLSCIVLIKR